MLSWIIEPQQKSAVTASLSYFCTPLVMKSCMRQDCWLMSDFSYNLNCAVSGSGWCFLHKNKGEPCCHTSALFFGGTWMDGGDGRTPGRGLVCPDSPPVSELKRFRLHVCRMEGGRAAEPQRVWCGEERHQPACCQWNLDGMKCTTEVNEKVWRHTADWNVHVLAMIHWSHALG